MIRRLAHTLIQRFRKSSQPMDDDSELSPEADRFLAEACAKYQEIMEAVERDWRLSTCIDWAFDQDTGLLSAELEDGAKWEADTQILGSYSTEDQTWEWAWNNPCCQERMARDSRTLREFGERFNLRYLRLTGYPIPGEEFLAYLSAIGVKASDSLGIFEAETGAVVVFLLLKELRWTKRPATL